MVSDGKYGIACKIYNLDNLPEYIYKTDRSVIYCAYDMNGNRVRKSIVDGTDRFYFYGKGGSKEAVCLLPYSSDLTFNILGAGGDNIGQVRVKNDAVSGRYYYLKDHLYLPVDKLEALK